MTISGEAIDHLMKYHWPGNVRELGNLIERAVVLAKEDEILPEALPLIAASSSEEKNDFEKPDDAVMPYHDAVRLLQREVIQRALQRSEGSQTRAAELLKLQRSYLSRLIKNFEMR
jgi:DNA-binding NtrC family response regulator